MSLCVLLGKVSIQVLCPFVNWIFFFPVLSPISSLYILGLNLCPMYHWQIVLPCGQFPFHFDDGFFNYTEAFYFEVTHMFIFSFISLSLGDIYQKKYSYMGYLKYYCLCFPQGLLWYHNLYLSLLSIVSLFWCMV